MNAHGVILCSVRKAILENTYRSTVTTRSGISKCPPFKTIARVFSAPLTFQRNLSSSTTKMSKPTVFLRSEDLLTPLDSKPILSDISTWPNDPLLPLQHWYLDAEAAYLAATKQLPANLIEAIDAPNTMQIATCAPSEDSVNLSIPRVRTILLKGLDSRGLIFFTNYNGDKGKELAVNPNCSINLYWKTLDRQIRVDGVVEKLPATESDHYFHSRLLGSQVSASVSPQSAVIQSREQIEKYYVNNVVRVIQELSNATLFQAAPDGIRSVKVLPLDPSCTDHLNPIESAEDVHNQHAEALKVLSDLQKKWRNDPVLHERLQRIVERPDHWGGFVLKPHTVEFWGDGKYRLHSRIRYTKINARSASSESPSTDDWKLEMLAP